MANDPQLSAMVSAMVASSVTVGGAWDTGSAYYDPFPNYYFGPTWLQCGVCGAWHTGLHYHVSPPVWTAPHPYPIVCGSQFHDFAQLKGTEGKARLFCRKCGDTRTV